MGIGANPGGYYGDHDHGFIGDIDEVAIYPTALTQSQIAGRVNDAGLTDPGTDPWLDVALLTEAAKRGGHNGLMSCVICELQAMGFGQPIDASTGNFYHSFSDVAVPGRGPALAFSRTYNSDLATTPGWLGRGWTTAWSTYLDVTSTKATVRQDNGAEATFTKVGGNWVADPMVIGDLTYSSGTSTYTLVRDHMDTLTFRSDGHLTAITDRNGYTTTLTYGSGAVVPSTITEATNVTTGTGRSLTLAWSGSGSSARLTSVTDPAGHVTSYSVNATTDDLDSVTDARGGVSKFTYDSSHRMLTMQSPQQAAAHPSSATTGAVTNAYDSSGRVTDQWSATATSGISGVNTNPTHFAYTPNKTTITDPEGNVTVQAYMAGRLMSETRGAGTADAGTWTFEYDAVTGGISKVTDPNGNHTTTTWYGDCTGLTDCASGRVHTSQNDLDPATTYTYDSTSGLPKTVTGPYGTSATYTNTTTYTYANHVNLASVSTPLMDSSTPPGVAATRTTTFAHTDSAHPEDVTSVTDPRSKVSTFTYDAYGNVVSATDPLTHQTTTAYDVMSRPTSTVPPEGTKSGGDANRYRSAVVYDPAGLALASLGSGTYPVVDAFDRSNGSLGSADAGQSWTATTGTFAVDAKQAKLSTASGSYNLATTAVGSGDMTVGFTSATAQADVGVAFRVSDSTHFWQVTASPSTNKWNLILHNGSTITTAASSPASTCCAAGQHVVVRAVGTAIKVYVDGTQQISFSSGTLAGATGAGMFAGATGSGRIDDWFAGRAIGGVAAAGYDPNGNAIAAVDPNGNVSSSSYTPDDLPDTVTQTDGTTLGTKWDGNGARISYTDGAGNTTTYGYDHQGRISSEHRPATTASTFAYAYSSSGETHTVTKPDGSTIVTTLDAVGRPHLVNYSDPGTADVTFAYDHGGHQLSMTPSTGAAASWTYDSFGQVTSSTRAGRTTGYEYDIAGNQEKIKYPSQATKVVRTFDDAGRMTAVTDFAGRTVSFGYDTNNNQTSTVFGPTGSPANTDIYTYDNSNALASVTWRQGNSTGTVLGSETYTRPATAVGMVTAITPASGGATAIGYNARNQVTSYTGKTTNTYDAANDLTKTSDGRLQVFDAAQRLCWSSATASSGTCTGTKPSDATVYGYDDNGNRTSAAPATSAAATYTYDQANRLTSAKVPSSLGGDGQLVTFGVTRMLDTNAGTGVCNTTPCARLTGSGTTTVTVAGQSPVPSTDVSAVWATVTVVNPAAAGSLKVNPTSGAAAMTLDYAASTTRNETAIIPLNSSGQLTLTSTTAVDVIIDVTGYFKTAGSPGDTYNASAPSRMVDTRNGTGTCNGTACSTPAAGSTTLVTAAGQAGLPSTGLHAAVVSITAVSPASSGSLKVSGSSSTGGAATIAYVSGKTINETVIAPVDANGKLSIYVSTSVDFVIDVSGYFTTPATGSLGLAYHPLTPTNLVTSSTGTGPCVGATCAALVASTRQTVQVAGNAGVPTSATAVVGSLTLTNPAGEGYARLNPTFTTGMGLGGDESINYNTGVNRNTTVLIPLQTDGTIQIVSTVAAGWTLDITGYLTQPEGTWTYHYDPTGLRDSKTSPGPSPTTTDFTYTGDGALPLLLEQTIGSATTSIIYGPGGQPIEEIESNGEAIWLHEDQIGSVRMATAATSGLGSVGASISAQAFDAYGNLATVTGTLRPLLGYAGQFTDSETGLQYLRARYFDPTTGQFLTLDPITASTQQAYAYAGDDPLNASDPPPV